MKGESQSFVGPAPCTLDGAGGVSFLSGENSDLFVEALSNGTATLTYAYTGTGDAAGLNCFASLKMTAWEVGMAMDGDRDGEIAFDGTNDASYVFWVNDDHDCLHYEEDEGHEDDSLDWADGADTPNCDDDQIGAKGYYGGNPPSDSENHCLRDLEDFTRLHIRIGVDVSCLSNVTYWLKFENGASGDPSVNLFEAVDETSGYLSDINNATLQIQKTRLLTVGTDEVELSSDYVKSNGEVSPFLLEGKQAGKGRLTLTVKKGGVAVCKAAVTLDLRLITSFYQVFRVETVGQNSADVSSGYNPDFVKSDDYLLFVHGFNVDVTTKTYWPGTVFKRLWWQGYKGSFGFFDWPCTMLDYLDLTCYDNSEYNAWRCGAALLDRVNLLNSGNHSGKVRLLAHSQGNVVAGEALRLATGQVVHTYVASQAAVSADLYQSGIPEYFADYTTPDVLSAYPATTNCYLAGVANKAANLFSYYNEEDYALHSAPAGSWEQNNRLKPDMNYHYEGPATAYDTTAQPTPSRFYYDSLIPLDERTLTFTNDTHEIFSYAAESRGVALGVQSSLTEFTLFDLAASPLSYTGAHYSRSRQFRSNVLEEGAYWDKVLQDCQCDRVP